MNIVKQWKVEHTMANGKETIGISTSYYKNNLTGFTDMNELEIYLVNDLLTKAFNTHKNGEYNYEYLHHSLKTRNDHYHLEIKLKPIK